MSSASSESGGGIHLAEVSRRHRDQPRFREAQHRLVGGRIDQPDIQARRFGKAPFFLGDPPGREGDHDQCGLVALAYQNPSQPRAVLAHEFVAQPAKWSG